MFTYDALGNMLTKTDVLNHVTQFRYDLMGRLIQKTYPDGSKKSYSYDRTGNTFVTISDQAGDAVCLR